MSEGYKKAALRIHGLIETDRQWVLDKLPERERNELNAFLAQLNEMKVPGGNSTFSDLIDRASGNYQDMAAAGRALSPSKVDAVNTANSDSVISILTREPDWLIALVLLSSEWDWTESFIRSLDSDRRTRIYALIKEMSPRLQPKLQETIIELLAQALAAEKPEIEDGVTSRFSTLFGKFGVETSGITESTGKPS
jgi:hypothetical protein